MATPTTSAVYIHVIEDVISKVREDFLQFGAEDTLAELQALWETKLMHSGALCGSIERTSLSSKPPPPPPPSAIGGAVHDLNVPYQGIEEYETPTADMLFPPTPLQTPIQTPPLPGTTEQSIRTPSNYPTAIDTGSAIDSKPGRPSPYMQPPSPWMNQRPLGVDVNVASVEGRDELERGAYNQNMAQEFFTMSSGKRKREDFAPHFDTSGCIPQQDGAGDATSDVLQLMFFESHGNKCQTGASGSKNGQVSQKLEVLSDMRASLRIPQQDGPIAGSFEDVYPYQGVVNEDYNLVNTPAGHDLQAGTLALTAAGDGDNGDDEPPLNENDDDDFDDVDEGEEPNTHDLVLSQFEKVTRTKSRWKCTLKGGIMRINDKDVLFNKSEIAREFLDAHSPAGNWRVRLLITFVSKGAPHTHPNN